MPKSVSELKILKADGEIEPFFKQLHHFAKRPPFKTMPTTFANFVSYCDGLTVGIRPNQENERTIQRIYRFVELVRARTHKGSAAVTEAWRAFPLTGA